MLITTIQEFDLNCCKIHESKFLLAEEKSIDDFVIVVPWSKVSFFIIKMSRIMLFPVAHTHTVCPKWKSCILLRFIKIMKNVWQSDTPCHFDFQYVL